VANKGTYNDREWIKAHGLSGLAQDAHVKRDGGGMPEPAIFGRDLFGDVITQPSRGKVADDFVCPPFSVLSSREGWWQERKAAWVARGIKGEVGRSDKLTFGHTLIDGVMLGDKNGQVSVFDPVLCELVYRWFSPPAGLVLDPFAGGSVRGVVAALLGRRYHGIELRPEQVAANREQAARICPEAGRIPVRVSAAMMHQPFHPCTPDFIAGTCRAACCESSTHPDGIIVSIHPSEAGAIGDRGGVVVDGFLRPHNGARRCPFKAPDDLCTLHAAGAKPFGCVASPFTLNDRDTLIVRNRYRLLRCYKADGAVPAYVAHRASLDRIFGPAEAARIAAHLDGGGEDLGATIDPAVYAMLKDNDDAKHGAAAGRTPPALEWVCGDAAAELPAAPMADLIFSCPPYADLERYSDDPRDLSTMPWPAFLAAYRGIVAKACERLRPDRFACFVVGDVRDKDGFYRNLPGETVRAFADAGLRLYNEAILATPVGSLPIRINAQFTRSRKLGKTHQNIVIFVKGCPKRAAALMPMEAT
jgi:uncharacterized protein YwbE